MTVGTSNTEAQKWKYDLSDEFLSKDLPPTFHSYLSGAIIEMNTFNLGTYLREYVTNVDSLDEDNRG